MAMDKNGPALVLRENGEWLRYVFWGAAVGMGLLAVHAIGSPVRDFGKIIGSALGILLFGFSGCVLQIRRIAIDPLRREVIITSKGFRQTHTERLRFAEIRKILLFRTFDSVENLRGVNVMRERWSLALVLEVRNVPINKNLYITKEHALRDAKKMQRLLGVEVIDSVAEGIAHLAQAGRKVEAMTLASRALGMTTTQAKEHVEGNASPTAQPGGRPSP